MPRFHDSGRDSGVRMFLRTPVHSAMFRAISYGAYLRTLLAAALYVVSPLESSI